MRPALPIVQFQPRDGILDLGWGHPHPDALPVDEWADAYARALRRHGPDALAYGHSSGPGPLVEWLEDRVGAAGQVFVTAGASPALELLATILIGPGDVVLVQSPTYHLALRILGDHAERVVPAPSDEEGVDPAATADLIQRLRRDGHRVSALYLVPLSCNPTGRTIPVARRTALAEMADRTGICLIEDNTYWELSYDAPPAPWLAGVGENTVRIGSFSKTVAPGLRLGWLTGRPSLLRTLADRGYVDSGGGLNHTTALAMATFAASGGYDRHVGDLRGRYTNRRDELVAALGKHLSTSRFTPPGGGWFLWLRLPDGLDPAVVLPLAEAHGVSFLPGHRFFCGPADMGFVRLSYSLVDRLDDAARRLATAVARTARS